MRKKIVAGNWKMNMRLEEARELFSAVQDQATQSPFNTTVIVGAPYLYLQEFAAEAKGNTSLAIAAQNCAWEESGAYTGEISAAMLAAIGVPYVIIGHSERRHLFGEDDAILARKVKMALRHTLKPIYCVGEQLEQREDETHFATIEEQLTNGLGKLSSEEMAQIVVAYEPVWAIGTGKTASPQQVQEMHAHIRKVMGKLSNTTIAEECSVLYGGSVKPTNAKELFAQQDVDGGLIGGAALNAESFEQIIQSIAN